MNDYSQELVRHEAPVSHWEASWGTKFWQTSPLPDYPASAIYTELTDRATAVPPYVKVLFCEGDHLLKRHPTYDRIWIQYSPNGGAYIHVPQHQEQEAQSFSADSTPAIDDAEQQQQQPQGQRHESPLSFACKDPPRNAAAQKQMQQIPASHAVGTAASSAGGQAHSELWRSSSLMAKTSHTLRGKSSERTPPQKSSSAVSVSSTPQALHPPSFLPTLAQLMSFLSTAPEWTPLDLSTVDMAASMPNVTYSSADDATTGAFAHAWTHGYNPHIRKSTPGLRRMGCALRASHGCDFSCKISQEADKGWSATLVKGVHSHGPQDVTAAFQDTPRREEYAVVKRLMELHKDQITARWIWVFLNIQRRLGQPVLPRLLSWTAIAEWLATQTARGNQHITPNSCCLCPTTPATAHAMHLCKYREAYTDMLAALGLPDIDRWGRLRHALPVDQDAPAEADRTSSASPSTLAPASSVRGSSASQAPAVQPGRSHQRIANEGIHGVQSEGREFRDPIAVRTRGSKRCRVEDGDEGACPPPAGESSRSGGTRLRARGLSGESDEEADSGASSNEDEDLWGDDGGTESYAPSNKDDEPWDEDDWLVAGKA